MLRDLSGELIIHNSTQHLLCRLLRLQERHGRCVQLVLPDICHVLVLAQEIMEIIEIMEKYGNCHEKIRKHQPAASSLYSSAVLEKIYPILMLKDFVMFSRIGLYYFFGVFLRIGRIKLLKIKKGLTK